MAYWLIKTEPDDWSWDEQIAKGKKGEPWTGVRNNQARNHMQAMKKGDLAFFYHTGKERRVMGVVKVIKEAYPDFTADDPRWEMVDVSFVESLPKPVTLADIKATVSLNEMVLVKNSRLSVQPVKAAEWKAIRKMGGLKS